MPQRILVTGGAGFLGSWLCERLLKLGHEVMCLDNFYTGHRSNLAHMPYAHNLEIIRHDIIDPMHLECDRIYNLACPASPIHYQKEPVRTVKTCVHGAINVLDLARHLNVPVLQASTSEVYGDPDVSPQNESYWGRVNPIGARSCYDEGKRCAETLFFDYHRQYKVDIKVARIFNTYGPRMQLNDGRVVSNFIVQALQNRDITIYGDGSQSRSFCYVTDTVDALVTMMNQHKTPGPINIGNPCEMTVRQLAETIIRLTNSRSELRFMRLPENDPQQRKPDIQKARDILYWEPQVELQDGLEETIAYFRKMLV